MNRKDTIHQLIEQCAEEMFAFIKETELEFADGWVPATIIKSRLDLNFLAVPKANKQYGEKGWLFGILARMLEDAERLEHKKETNKRSFYRSKNN